ncbi:MAG: MraY family glycosyltransferase [bacterium]|nr:MraY family glycosyltransferase [bacterium]
MTSIFLFSAAFSFSILATWVIKKIALRFDITDKPGEQRKIHTRPIPLLGGCAVYCGVVAVLFLYSFFAPPQWPSFVGTNVSFQQLTGILLGGAFLMLGGALDDRYVLKPLQQIIWPIFAVGTVIASGVVVDRVTNPFGGTIELASLGLFFPQCVTFLWLMIVIYTTKFLDGLDGLVSGMTVIGSLIIALLSLFFFINIPTALLAIITAGAFAGFLVFNFHPAKIFLGEAGSTFAGLMLGVLAVMSGAKFATAVLILGLPILDATWVIFRRVVFEKKSPFKGDRKHLHFRLLDAGLSHRQAVLFIYLLGVGFGLSALFLQSAQKLVSIALLGIILCVVLTVLFFIERKKLRLTKKI